MPSDFLYSPVASQDDDEDKLSWRDRFPGYLINFVSILFMVISFREHLPMTYACQILLREHCGCVVLLRYGNNEGLI